MGGKVEIIASVGFKKCPQQCPVHSLQLGLPPPPPPPSSAGDLEWAVEGEKSKVHRRTILEAHLAVQFCKLGGYSLDGGNKVGGRHTVGVGLPPCDAHEASKPAQSTYTR